MYLGFCCYARMTAQETTATKDKSLLLTILKRKGQRSIHRGNTSLVRRQKSEEKVGHKPLLWLLQEGMGKQAKQLSFGLGNLVISADAEILKSTYWVPESWSRLEQRDPVLKSRDGKREQEVWIQDSLAVYERHACPGQAVSRL